MKLKSIFLVNFRNYEQLNLEFFSNINIFYGNNGHGKTNILEAIYFCALGSSHRTNQESDLIKNDTDSMSAIVNIISKNEIGKTITIKKYNRKSKKEILVEKEKIKPRELIGQYYITMFSPEDLQLIKSDPALRRRFLDIELSQINSIYCFSLSRYNKILQHRNKILEQIREKKSSIELLNIWDEQFSKEAAYIFSQRLKIIKKISLLANSIYSQIADNSEQIDIIYNRKDDENIDLSEDQEKNYFWYKEKLNKKREKDILRGITTIGPHRDDLIFTLNGLIAKSFASQGQQRSIILALKMAQIQLIKQECGQYPILLLDDVMSELDVRRRHNLLNFLNDKVQTFITLTEKNIIDDFKSAKFFKIKSGTVTEE